MMKKIIMFVFLVCVLMLVCGCSNKAAEDLEKAKDLLQDISEELRVIYDDCESAYRREDFDSMQEELGMTCLRCKELRDTIDDALLFGFKR